MEKTIILHPNFHFLENNFQKDDYNIGKVTFDTFPDSWPNIFFEKPDTDIKWKEIIYIWDFSKPEFLFTNYSIIRSFFLYKAKKIDIILPFHPVATMERIIHHWEVATSKYFADIIGHLPNWLQTKTTIHIFDIHSLEQQFFFNDFNISIELHSLMNLIKNKISKETIIVFPDEWAKKRFSNYFPEYEKIFCSKVRKWDTREIQINEWNIENKEVIIIDDLIQTWWTIIKTAEILRKKWAKKVFAFASHWVFPNNSYEKIAKNLDTLYITDSLPKIYWNLNNIEVLSIYKNIKSICETL